MWRNLPRGFNCRFEGDKFSYSAGRQDHASVYIDGGKPENKLQAEKRTTIQEGTIIYFRPAIKERSNPFMVNMEFHVIASDDNANASPSSATIATTENPLPVPSSNYPFHLRRNTMHILSVADTKDTIEDTIMDNVTAEDATAAEDAIYPFSCVIHEYHDHMRFNFAAELEDHIK